MKLKQKEISLAFLDDLRWKDYLHGITDPQERKIAKKHGLLKWTGYFKKNHLRAFSTGSLMDIDPSPAPSRG